MIHRLSTHFQLCLSTYLFLSFVGTFVARPPSLSPHCFCPIWTALFFIASLFLPSIRLCDVPLSPELLHIHLFSSIWQSGENVCVVYLEMASWNAELLKKWPGFTVLSRPTHTETHMHSTMKKRIRFWPSFCVICRISDVLSLPKCSKDVELCRAGKAATLLNNSLSHCACSSSSLYDCTVWTKT